MPDSPAAPLVFNPADLNRLADILELGAMSAADGLGEDNRNGFCMGVRYSAETLRALARETS
jgi:hypothetical protein